MANTVSREVVMNAALREIEERANDYGDGAPDSTPAAKECTVIASIARAARAGDISEHVSRQFLPHPGAAVLFPEDSQAEGEAIVEAIFDAGKYFDVEKDKERSHIDYTIDGEDRKSV